MSPSFGVRWLGPRIARFAAENPEWNIRIDATPDFTTFETEAFDLDLRYGLGGWTGLAVNCVMRDLVLPMCSPDYLAMLQEHSKDPIQQLGAARLIDSVKLLYRWDLWLASSRGRWRARKAVMASPAEIRTVPCAVSLIVAIISEIRSQNMSPVRMATVWALIEQGRSLPDTYIEELRDGCEQDPAFLNDPLTSKGYLDGKTFCYHYFQAEGSLFGQ